MTHIKFLSGLGLMILVIAGCKSTGTWEKQEREQIDNYIKSLGDTVYVLKPSGLYYIELKPGSGRSPIVKDTITFWYKGMFLDRVVFDPLPTPSTPTTAIIGTDNPTYKISLSGLDEGVQYMKEGGKARFLLPSDLAYGPAGLWQIIPGYTPLIYEVQLLKVRAGSKK